MSSSPVTSLRPYSVSMTCELADWLALQRDASDLNSKIKYTLLGRIFLIGTSIHCLAEAVSEIALGCISFMVALFGIFDGHGGGAASIVELDEAFEDRASGTSDNLSVLVVKL